MLCNCLAYFSQNPQIPGYETGVYTGGNSVFFRVFFFQFIFAHAHAPDMLACAIFRKIKTNASRLYKLFNLFLICFDFLPKIYAPEQPAPCFPS